MKTEERWERSDDLIPPNKPMSIETPFTPPLHHDREEFRDWGWVRDDAGVLIYAAKLPICPNSPEADEHRRNKTDPTQARVDALLEAFAAKERLEALASNRWALSYNSRVGRWTVLAQAQVVGHIGAGESPAEALDAAIRNRRPEREGQI